MGTRAAKDGESRRMAAKVWLGAAAVLIGLSSAALRRPSPPDIHSEYVKYLSGRDTITAYLAYPERPTPAPAVMVIHEIFGMSDFVRQTAEQLAKDGFVAIAPDLLSHRGGTPATPDSARKVIATLSPDTITLDLNATQAFLKSVKSARADAVGVIGFCWGGGQSFRYATNTPGLRAFVVCYGPGPTRPRSRESRRKVSACTPRTTPVSMPASTPSRRPRSRQAWTTATPSIPASATASCAPATNRRSPTARGTP